MKIKRRFLLLGSVIMFLLIASMIYITVHGHSYTERIEKTFLLQPGQSFSEIENKITAVPETEGIVEVGKIYSDGDDICVEFDSLKEGGTDVKVTAGKYSYTIPLHVTRFGTIVSPISLNFDGFIEVEYVIILCFLMTFAVMVYSFAECVAKRKFSYSMIAYGGLAFFNAFLLFFALLGMRQYNFFRGFLLDMLNTGYQMSILTAPFMLAFCAAIAVSNIRLMRREGFKTYNMLGIILAFIWLLGVVSIYFSFDLLIDFDLTAAVAVSFSISYILSFFECLLLSTVLGAFLAAKRKASLDLDYLIILGCRVLPDGKPTPILKSRTDAAIDFEKKQFAAKGTPLKFVPSGGKGCDEVISESECMKRYLTEQGYSENRIIKEDKSVNTDQNFKFSREKIIADAGSLDNVKIGFATTNYHVFRGYVLAKKHDLRVQGIASKTKWYFFPNAFLREFAGLVAERKWKIAAALFMVLAGFALSIHMLNLI